MVLRSAAARVLAARNRLDTHTKAVALLVSGRSADAAAILEQLAPQRGAEGWSDLSAALLAVAQQSGDASRLPAALAAADEAIRRDENSAEAWFNRGTILDAMGINSAAIDAFQRYLKIDRASPWAAEARAFLRDRTIATEEQQWSSASATFDRALSGSERRTLEELVRRFPQRVRGAAEGPQLVRWANAVRDGDSKTANAVLRSLQILASTFAERTGDAFLRDVVGALERASAAEQLDSAAAILDYQKGRGAWKSRRITEAKAFFTSAERKLRPSNPLRLLVSYYSAAVDFAAHEPRAAEAKLEEVDSRLADEYRALEGEVAWQRMLHTGYGGDLYTSLQHCRRAIALFEGLGFRENVVRMRTNESSLLSALGREREAWTSRRALFQSAEACGRPAVVEESLYAAAMDEVDASRWHGAVALFDVQLRAASSSPRLRFDAHLWRAIAEARVRNRPPDLRQARQVASALADAALREEALDQLAVVEARSILSSRPHHATELLTTVIRHAERSGRTAQLPLLLADRARAAAAAKNLERAANDFRAAAELLDTRERLIGDDRLRNTFFGTARDVFDDWTEHLLAHGDSEAAFGVSDRARARLIRRSAGNSLNPTAVQRELEQGEAVLHITTLPTHVFVVGIERDRVTKSVVRVGRPAVAEAAKRLERAIQIDDVAKARAEARVLSRILLEPAKLQLSAGSRLIIVPDETSAAIPFAVLPTRDNRLLIDAVTIAVAPTAGVLVGRHKQQDRIGGDFEIGIIADPEFSESVFGELRRLPAAAADARRLRAQFEHAETCEAGGATRDCVLDLFRRMPLVHVAAHASAHPRDAALSAIALAPRRHDTGALYLDEILALDLRHRPLIVLAGCRTAVPGGGSGSIRSLSLAFLAAGAATVVGTTWNIEDGSATTMTTNFYDALRKSADPATALREAQLRARARGVALSAWSAFHVLTHSFSNHGKLEP